MGGRPRSRPPAADGQRRARGDTRVRRVVVGRRSCGELLAVPGRGGASLTLWTCVTALERLGGGRHPWPRSSVATDAKRRSSAALRDRSMRSAVARGRYALPTALGGSPLRSARSAGPPSSLSAAAHWGWAIASGSRGLRSPRARPRTRLERRWARSLGLERVGSADVDECTDCARPDAASRCRHAPSRTRLDCAVRSLSRSPPGAESATASALVEASRCRAVDPLRQRSVTGPADVGGVVER